MPNYRFHELSLSSPVELPELAEVEAHNSPACHIRYEVVSKSSLLEIVDDQEVSVDYGTAATVVTFRSGVEFVISNTADEVVVRHGADAEFATVRHLLLDQALPRLLAMRGYFTAHASGVQREGRALVFLGESGHGKSSMAAGLHRAGNDLLGDDCFTLVPSVDGTVTALSTYRSMRLLPESIDEFYPDVPDATLLSMGAGYQKVRIVEETMVEPRPLPVAGLFILGSSTDYAGPPVATHLSGRDAVLALTKNSFRLDPAGALGLGAALDQAQVIASQVSVVELQFERSFRSLHRLHQVIFDSISESG